MSETTISVTEAARNFADCVNRVHYQSQTFVVLKNGVPFARLVPAGQPVCFGRDLAEVLGSVELTGDDSNAWNHDLREARKKLKAPPDKWQ